jgi:hypothetical protein
MFSSIGCHTACVFQIKLLGQQALSAQAFKDHQFPFVTSNLHQDSIGPNAEKFQSIGFGTLPQKGHLAIRCAKESVASGNTQEGHGGRMEDGGQKFALGDFIDSGLNDR